MKQPYTNIIFNFLK